MKPARILITVILTLIIGGVVLIIAMNLRSGDTIIHYKIRHQFSIDDPAFQRTISLMPGPPLVGGNRVTALQNGKEIFPAMLEAIRSAEKTITFETYIYWSGEIGREFVDAFVERANAGVRVHVLLDWVGSGRIDDAYYDELEAAGVEVELYRPLHWYNLGRMNHRTHRKLLIVDGKVGFTGGVGIADLWKGDARNPDEWRDCHYRFEGPVVAQMQAVFTDNWIKTSGRVLIGDAYFPELDEVGNSTAQMFKSSWSGGSESARLLYLVAISSATRRIRLQSSYFIPDELAIATFKAAIDRGVSIQVIVPGDHMDVAIVGHASRALWGELLDMGVEIFEYQPTMYHCKVLIVDGLFVSVGSTTFDDRSFRLNDEASGNVIDAEFAAAQEATFEGDKMQSNQITRADLRARSKFEVLKDEIAILFRRQL